MYASYQENTLVLDQYSKDSPVLGDQTVTQATPFCIKCNNSSMNSQQINFCIIYTWDKAIRQVVTCEILTEYSHHSLKDGNYNS